VTNAVWVAITEQGDSTFTVKSRGWVETWETNDIAGRFNGEKKELQYMLWESFKFSYREGMLLLVGRIYNAVTKYFGMVC
jgi:hypothetical protein